MIENKKRISNFTSSQMYRLVGLGTRNATKEEIAEFKKENPKSQKKTIKCENTFDEKAYTYIEEKIYEKALKRSIDTGAYSQSMAWGKFLEKRVNDNLGMEYSLISKTTFSHPKYDFWTGSPDFVVQNIKDAELKCYEPKNFASYATALLTENTEIIKEKHPKEYWQIISNSIILGVPKGEAILYMPYESEMDEVRELAENPEYLQQIGMMPWEVRFIVEKSNSQLAVLPDDSSFPNLIKFEFDIPVKDAEFLTKRVLMASKILNNGV